MYTFLKQHPEFQISRQQFQADASQHPQMVLTLSGAMYVTVGTQQLNCPITIVIPGSFPATAPRVFLAYQLSAEAAEANPYIKNGSEVINTFLHSWDGSNFNYNLCGLFTNLQKSFAYHPPVNTAAPKPAPAPAPPV